MFSLLDLLFEKVHFCISYHSLPTCRNAYEVYHHKEKKILIIMRVYQPGFTNGSPDKQRPGRLKYKRPAYS
jgi:hypothetical protein